MFLGGGYEMNISIFLFLHGSARAYHPDDLRKNESLEVDVDYYLKNQIHPVVSRLMEPIEGTNNAQIAECLGLDPSSFRREYTMQVGSQNGKLKEGTEHVFTYLSSAGRTWRRRLAWA